MPESRVKIIHKCPTTTQLPILNALTIDVEDWYQLANRKLMGRFVPASPRVLTNTYWILDLLAKNNIRSTFFVLGRVAEQYPALVRCINGAGHEVATHGYSHSLVYHMGPEAFRTELVRSINILEDITQRAVLGHRAPEFSINGNPEWAFEIMLEAGLNYDSSVFPIWHPRYGMPSYPRHPYVLQNTSGKMVEFPLATSSFLGINFPIAGGGYLRLLPFSLIRSGVYELNRQGYMAVLYVHPYEFDEEWLDLAIPSTSLRRKMNLRMRSIRRNWGRGRPMRAKFEALLGSFSFTSLSELVSHVQQQ